MQRHMARNHYNPAPDVARRDIGADAMAVPLFRRDVTERTWA